MSTVPTKEKFQAVFLAIMFGDAMGQAVETMSRTQIKKATDGRGITFFSKPLQTKIAENRDLAAGQTTDDWQLTRLVAESLIACNGYSQEDVARRHADLFNEHLAACGFMPDDQDTAKWLSAQPMRQTELAGWGGTTKRAVAELHLGFLTDFKKGRHFNTPAPKYGKKMGAGNGVAMKVAPLVLWHWAHKSNTQDLADDICALACLTHCHPDAYYASVAYAAALSYCLEFGSMIGPDPYDFLLNLIMHVTGSIAPDEYPLLADNQTVNLLESMADEAEAAGIRPLQGHLCNREAQFQCCRVNCLRYW